MSGFDLLAGNTAALSVARSMAQSGRFAQSIVIEGPQGSGRRTLAGLIAQAALCTAPEGQKPCGQCTGCKKAQAGTHPDLTVLTASGAMRALPVASVRALRTDAYIRPNEAPHKVFAIFNAQSLTEQGQNALLKVIEEPPEYLLFLFTCFSRSQLLATVLSRSVVLTMGAVDPAQGLAVLHDRCPDRAEQELRQALSDAGGLIGPALERLDAQENRADSLAVEMARALTEHSELPLLKLCAQIERDRDLQRQTLESLLELLRDAYAMRAGCELEDSFRRETAQRLAGALTARQIKNQMEEVAGARSMIERNVNGPLLMCHLCARLRDPAE